MYKFFDSNENELRNIIKTSTKRMRQETVTISCIKTGWTNVVFDVQCYNCEYIFRFPRTAFFAKEMIRDCTMCNLIHGKLPIQTPNIRLEFDNGRPFSIHKKIIGTALSDLDYSTISDENLRNIADSCGHFLAKLHELPAGLLPADYQITLNDYLLKLAEVHNGDYMSSLHQGLQEIEESCSDMCIVHGDFHPGNILVDADMNVAAVIDFSFASLSDRSADIGRFLSRTNHAFSNLMIESYNKYSRIKCKKEYVNIIANIFKYVDCKYINYMHKSHPSVAISDTELDHANSFLNCINLKTACN